MEDFTLQPEALQDRLMAVAAHPLAELLDCPQTASNLLHSAACSLNFEAGLTVFRQHEACKGLYVIVSGDFTRKAERFQQRVTLGAARAGDLVELAAALGDGHHTYSLTAITQGSVLLLPMEALQQSFVSFPPLRMRLLEELAREVSRAYLSCCLSRIMPARRQGTAAARGE